MSQKTLGFEPASGAIHRSSSLPFYVQLAEILRAQIKGGVWRAGDLLPSEADLGSSYDISRTAVRQALDELVVEGLVEKEKGKGSFVAHPRTARFIVQELRGFFEEMTSKGFKVETRILEKEIATVPQHVAPELHLPTGAEVVSIDRIRSADGVPIVHVVTHLPATRFRGLADMDLNEESLYSVLANKFGLVPGGGHRQIDAVGATRDKANLLQIEVGSPLLRMTAVNHDAEGRPFEYFRAWYRGDVATFDVQVQVPTPK